MRTRARLLALAAMVTTASATPGQTPSVPPAQSSVPASLPNLPNSLAAPAYQAPKPMTPATEMPSGSVPAPMPGTSMAPAVIPPMTPPSSIPQGCTSCGDLKPGCTDPGCGGFNTLMGPKNAVWLGYNHMLLWFKPSGQHFPIATNAANRTGTTLLGVNNVEQGMYNAFGVNGGMWMNEAHTLGVGLDGFITEHRSTFSTITSNGGATISRPFIDAVTATNSSLLVAAPGIAGAISVANTARFASAGVNLQKVISHNQDHTFTTFYGFRYYDLDESFTIFQRTTLPNSQAIAFQMFPAGTSVQLTDRVYTRNQFYGGEFGGRFEFRHGMAFLAFTPKVALGPVHQVTYIDGLTRADAARFQGGLLAAGASPNGNIGRFITNRFSVAGDFGAQLGFQVAKGIRISAGYNFLFLNDVTRPASQLDTVVNTRVVPVSNAFGSVSGPVAPRVTFDREGFYAHGLSFLAEVSY